MNRSIKIVYFPKFYWLKKISSFLISISTLKYQSLYVARKKTNTANLVGTNEKEVKATVVKTLVSTNSSTFEIYKHFQNCQKVAFVVFKYLLEFQVSSNLLSDEEYKCFSMSLLEFWPKRHKRILPDTNAVGDS